MSKTPLTDAQAYDVGGIFHENGAVVDAGFARHLEEAFEDARRELETTNTRLASILWSGALDDKLCGDIQKWAKDYTAEMAGLRAELRADVEKIQILARALEEIASYDRDSKHGEGICPYGCDTPWIAKTALDKVRNPL